MAQAPTVIVTRPAREAARWVEALRAAGLDAAALPLIAIEPATDRAPLADAWARLADYAALMFVSAAAVEHFFAAAPAAPDAAAFAQRRWWSTGPGTARALRQAGVPAAAIDTPSEAAAQFDSEALWQDVQAQVRPGLRVLIVRGGDAQGRPAGREWLKDRIESAGGQCEVVASYRRLRPVLDAAARALARRGAAGEAVWLFSSSEAVANLCAALPDVGWQAARAVATHARVAQAAQAARFGAVRVAPPVMDTLVASIESFR